MTLGFMREEWKGERALETVAINFQDPQEVLLLPKDSIISSLSTCTLSPTFIVQTHGSFLLASQGNSLRSTCFFIPVLILRNTSFNISLDVSIVNRTPNSSSAHAHGLTLWHQALSRELLESTDYGFSNAIRAPIVARNSYSKSPLNWVRWILVLSLGYDSRNGNDVPADSFYPQRGKRPVPCSFSFSTDIATDERS